MKKSHRYHARLVIRDADRVAAAIENLHRAVVKIKERAEKLPVGDLEFGDRYSHIANRLSLAQGALGHVLGYLDEVTSRSR